MKKAVRLADDSWKAGSFAESEPDWTGRSSLWMDNRRRTEKLRNL